MRAITIPRFGGPEVLEISEREDAAPKPGQVAIDVAFAGVNYAEVLYRRGAVDVDLPFISVTSSPKISPQGLNGCCW